MVNGCNDLFLFVGRLGCQNPKQAVEFQLSLRFRSEDEMTEMGRVKRAAKESDAIGHDESISLKCRRRTSVRRLCSFEGA